MTSPRPLHELGELQRELLELLWSRGPSTVRELLEALERPEPPAYTTVLSVVQKLEKAGWVRHEKEGRSHRYSAARSRGDEGRRSLRRIVERVFRGDPMALFQQLLRDERLGREELDALERLIEERRRAEDPPARPQSRRDQSRRDGAQSGRGGTRSGRGGARSGRGDTGGRGGKRSDG